jgi:uncharacterized protein YjbJ (UPF0337 family)
MGVLDQIAGKAKQTIGRDAYDAGMRRGGAESKCKGTKQ